MRNITAELKELFRDFNSNTASRLAQLYDKKIIFRDPVHELNGLSEMQRYFEHLSKNLDYCRFSYGDELIGDGKAYLNWEMRYRHQKISKGKEILVRGISHIEFGDNIVYHEDFYDMGAMLYEYIPIVGGSVRWLKKQLNANL